MSDPDADAVTVSEDDVTVRKSLNDEDFQTLAVVFDIRSERDEAVRVLLSDGIPDGVPIDDIGFHPDYGAEYWTVDGEMVAFERELDAGEEYTTIYGVREYDDETAEQFLSEPALEVVTATDDIPEPADALDEAVEEADEEADEPGESDLLAEEDSRAGDDDLLADEPAEVGDPLAESEPLDVDDIASEEASQEVRDVIAGERDTLSGLEDDEAIEEEEGAPPADDDAAPADEPAAPEEPAADTGGTDEPESADGDETEAEAAEASDVEEPAALSTGGVARVLAKELRQGQVSEADRELLRDEFGGAEGSTEARIQHLQNEVSDLAAYTDALEEFLDENGTAREVLEEVQTETAELREAAERIEDRTEETAVDVERVEETVSELESTVEDLRERLDVVDDLDERLADVEDRLDDLEDDLGDRVADVEDDLEAARDDIDEMAEFRERLTSVFGPAGGSGGDEDENGE